LAVRWSRQVWDADEIVSCGAFVCLAGADGVWALEPSTGKLLWYRSGWRSVEQHGDAVLAYSTPGTSAETIGIIDPGTGRILVGLRGWRPLNGTAGGGALLVARVVEAGPRTMVAVAGPGDKRPRPIAELPAGTGDCQTVPGRLVCRSVTGELVVWAYRQKG